MYEMAIKNEDENLQAVALTLKVYIAEVITALFGEVPYSEAFQWENGISHPKYDTQEEVYTQMINELNKANTLYNLSGQMDYPGEIYFIRVISRNGKNSQIHYACDF